MYSYEIKQLLELKNNLLNLKEYIEVIRTSPQIDRIKYEGDHFHFDTTDNFHFKFKIKEINSKDKERSK